MLNLAIRLGNAAVDRELAVIAQRDRMWTVVMNAIDLLDHGKTAAARAALKALGRP